MGAKPYIIELDQVGMSQATARMIDTVNDKLWTDDGAAIQDALEEMTTQRSVPNIFIAKQHIGGNSELQAKRGDLPTLLKDAGAI